MQTALLSFRRTVVVYVCASVCVLPIQSFEALFYQQLATNDQTLRQSKPCLR